MRAVNLAWLIGVCLLCAQPVAAEPTTMTVHVLSKGAKFVGSSMGGVQVCFSDAQTGQLLATAVTRGTTGSTAWIMRTAHQRGAVLSDEQTAGCSVTLDINEPLQLQVRACGPLAQPQARTCVSATQWVVPGRHITAGDAWLLELPGFVVDILAPAAHAVIAPAGDTLPLEANVTMMCGCPITPGGLWDADAYEIRAVVMRNDAPAGQVPLQYAGTASRFTAAVPLRGAGVYAVTVYAYDPANGNTGLDRVTFRVP